MQRFLIMLCRTMLAVASLIVTGSQAYAPIQMVSGQGKGLVVLPKGFPGNMRGALTPQKLSVRNPAFDDSPSSVPYFTAKIDQTIIWDDADWCLEATGNKHGDAVRVNICSGAQTQKWNWVPDGRGHNMIQLTDTDLCLDAIDNGVGSHGAPIELRGCGHEVAQWKFEEPLPIPGASQADSLSYKARNVMITVLTLAGLGALSFGARLWQLSGTGNQNQEKTSAELAFNSMQPSRVAQTRSSRTSNTSMADASPETSAAVPTQRRKRLLCLPGKGDNAVNFETRLHGLREIAELVCIDGPHPMGTGFAWWLLPPGERSFTSPVFEGWEESVAKVRRAWKEQGPFDGMLGFSQGAIFIAALCAVGIVRPSSSVAEPSEEEGALLRPGCLLLFGSHVPGPFKQELAAMSEECPDFNALHVVGTADEVNPPAGGRKVAAALGGSVFEHFGGHDLPMDEMAVVMYEDFMYEDFFGE